MLNPIIVGIDISKSTFDVYDELKGHRRYSNDMKGFRSFRRSVPHYSWAVLEVTGSYHYQLAHFLFKKGIPVSVVNPLILKRFKQMRLNRVKNDKTDAKLICHYGQEQELFPWRPDPTYIQQCKDLLGLVRVYFKHRTALKNKLHSLQTRGVIRDRAVTSLKRNLRGLEKEIKFLEDEIEAIITKQEMGLYQRLKSIPGLGKKTVILLIVATNGFQGAENSKQIASYFGIAPHERRSGSSVKRRSRISKNGNALVRNHLFLCSFTACQYNPQCKALYDRLVANGKSKKLALIAVSNKLIKQAHAIAKSGLYYSHAINSDVA